MDNKAYVDKRVWDAILEETGWNTVQLRDRRYDSVIHLVTAAEGAEDFYGYGNEARSETPEQARELDRAIIDAWSGHQRHFIIDNKKDGGFEGKMKASLDVILKSIGLSGSQTHYKEYIL